VRRPRRARTSLAVVVVALAGASAAPARFDDTLAAARRAVAYPRTADGMQARYDAGRNLDEAVYSLRRRQPECRLRAALDLAHGLIRQAEGYDQLRAPLEGAGRGQVTLGLRRLDGCPSSGGLVRLRRRAAPLVRLPALQKAAPERVRDASVSAQFARLGSGFPGWAAIWTHDLVTGRTAGWNSDAQFPAASTVKLGVLLAALRRGSALGSPLDYDLRAMTEWSSNLAANRLLTRVGGVPAVEDALRQAGATRSTYPQGFRVGTAAHALDVVKQPPRVSGRVTTAHDLGRILYVLHAGVLGNVPALRRSGLDKSRSAYALSLLLAAQPSGNNVGLVRPWLRPGTPIAQKNGWLHDARHTAAIVYLPRRPLIVVVLTYAPGLSLTTARTLGRNVLRAAR
jgi:beta-lactamase class A